MRRFACFFDIIKFMRLRVLSALSLCVLGCNSEDERASEKNVVPKNLQITEIHYHPTLEHSEFIEITNNESQAIDLSGWRLSGEINFTFEPSSVLSSGAKMVICEDKSTFITQYDLNPDGEFFGKLNNNGGVVQLLNTNNDMVDVVQYDDGSTQDKSQAHDGVVGEWPISADGEGFSLQVMAKELDNTMPSSWGSLLPSPGQDTPHFTPPPRVENLEWTRLPNEDQDIVVTADCVRCTAPVLETLVGYPGTPLDPVPLSYAGTQWMAKVIHAEKQPGELIRMRIVDGEHNLAPLMDDSRIWFGTTIKSPNTADIPKLEWFVDDLEFEEVITNTQLDIVKTAVIAYDGDIWDQSTYNLRGNYSRSQNKKAFKIRFPDHHKIDIEGMPNPVDNFDLASAAADESKIRQVLAHQLAGEMGVVNVKAVHSEVHKNGQFYALYSIQEHPDSDFRKRYGLSNSSFYDTGTDPIGYNLPPDTRRETENELVSGPEGHLPENVNFDDWNIPSWVNMMAASSVLGHSDFRMGNFYMWIDHEKGSRAEGMLWDMDLTLGRTVPPDLNLGAMVTVLEDPNIWTGWRRWKIQASEPAFLKPAVLDPILRQMYLRRVRTLANEFLLSGRLAQAALELFATIQPLWNIDNTLWPQFKSNNFNENESIDKLTNEFVQGLLAHIDAGGPDGDLPGQQPAIPNLTITGPIDLGTASEHIVIKNNENVSIDLSGAKVSGDVEFIFPSGSVLPPGYEGHIVQNDARDGFRGAYTSRLVFGAYPVGPLNESPVLSIIWPTP